MRAPSTLTSRKQNRTHLPRDLRRRICRGCGAFLVPGASSRTRIRQRWEPHVANTCLTCGHVTRIPLGRKATILSSPPSNQQQGERRNCNNCLKTKL